MGDGRGRAQWAQTSLLAALIANGNRDPKKTRAFSEADFDPYAAEDRRRAKAVTITKENVGLMKRAFESFRREKQEKRK